MTVPPSDSSAGVDSRHESRSVGSEAAPGTTTMPALVTSKSSDEPSTVAVTASATAGHSRSAWAASSAGDISPSPSRSIADTACWVGISALSTTLSTSILSGYSVRPS